MKETLKEHAGTVYTIVEAVVLGMSVCMLAWTTAKLVTLGEIVSAHTNELQAAGRRIEKLETAALLSATLPGKIDTLASRVENLLEGQHRIEKLLEDHSKSK